MISASPVHQVMWGNSPPSPHSLAVKLREGLDFESYVMKNKNKQHNWSQLTVHIEAGLDGHDANPTPLLPPCWRIAARRQRRVEWYKVRVTNNKNETWPKILCGLTLEPPDLTRLIRFGWGVTTSPGGRGKQKLWHKNRNTERMCRLPTTDV